MAAGVEWGRRAGREADHPESTTEFADPGKLCVLLASRKACNIRWEKAMSERPVNEIIDDFLAQGPYAVVGASSDRSKYGNKVLRAYFQSGREAWPINRKAEAVEGHEGFADLASLPEVPRGISIITPPPFTEKVVEQAAALGV